MEIEKAVATLTNKTTLECSAKQGRNIDKLLQHLQETTSSQYAAFDIIVSNARHMEAFQQAYQSLQLVRRGLEEKISGDFISIDIRSALQSLSSITGQISNEDILSAVFSRFCIGK